MVASSATAEGPAPSTAPAQVRLPRCLSNKCWVVRTGRRCFPLKSPSLPLVSGVQALVQRFWKKTAELSKNWIKLARHQNEIWAL